MLAEGGGAHTKMGTWAVDEREAELCELIADQDDRWDEAIVGKEQWINKPAQPPGLLRSGQLSYHCCLHTQLSPVLQYLSSSMYLATASFPK